MDGIERIEEIADPAERAREIGRRLGKIPACQERLRLMRQAAILEMRAKGMSFAEIGVELRMSRGRVQQISVGGKGEPDQE